MNNSDFLKEIHSYIDKTYKEFEKYQEIVLNILSEFDRICEKNNIHYWLAYGNMIGAARDHSQLPWDYDVDVVLPITERHKLIKTLERELGNEYSYAYVTNIKHYPTNCLRVYNKKYTWMALHVDVFFLIGAPTKKSQQELFFHESNRLKRIRSAKCLHYHLPVKINMLMKVVNKLRYLFIPEWRLIRKEESFISRYPFEKAEYYLVFGGVQKATFPKNIFQTIKVDINGKKYPIPAGYQEFLSRVYGDWQSYLPIKCRFDEFYKMKNLIDERQKFYLNK